MHSARGDQETQCRTLCAHAAPVGACQPSPAGLGRGDGSAGQGRLQAARIEADARATGYGTPERVPSCKQPGRLTLGMSPLLPNESKDTINKARASMALGETARPSCLLLGASAAAVYN